MRFILALALFFAFAGALPPPTRGYVRIPAWPAAQEASGAAEIVPKNFSVKLDGEPASIVTTRGPEDDLLVLVVLDVTEELGLADLAKPALVSAIQALPPKATVGLLRAQDGLRVVVDPTTDREAIATAINAISVSGKAGLLETVETAARIADEILSKAAVRVAVVYITDSNINNYRDDYINPVINSSDPHDMSRYFPEGLVRDKISKLDAKLARFEAPLFIVHLAYRNDRLNEAYQSGLMQLSATEGGSSAFCRSRAEIPAAISGIFRTIASHYSIVLRVPERHAKVIQVQVEAEGRTLTYRNRFIVP